MKMPLNINNGRARFFEIYDNNTRANLCLKYVLTSNHQKLQWRCCNEENFCTVQTEETTPSI